MNKFTRQFELNALHETFKPVLYHGRTHLHHTSRDWDTECGIGLLEANDYRTVEWDKGREHLICETCLEKAWISIFDYCHEDEAIAINSYINLVTLDNMLQYTSSIGNEVVRERMARMICVCFNRHVLNKWLRMMINAEELDKIFGKRWSVGPAGKPVKFYLHTNTDAEYNFSEAFALYSDYHRKDI